MTAPREEPREDTVEHCDGITQHPDGPTGIAKAKHDNVMHNLP